LICLRGAFRLEKIGYFQNFENRVFTVKQALNMLGTQFRLF